MRIIDKQTKEVVEAEFSFYHYNQEKRMREDGISVLVRGQKPLHYATLAEMMARWEDAPVETAETAEDTKEGE